MTLPAPCRCPVPAHHYGSPSSCSRPAAPGMSYCYGCYSAGHDRLGPCSPASHRRDTAHDHDPSGRGCALAGRRFAGHDVSDGDYCRPCYADLVRSASRDLCGDCALLGDPGSYAPYATRYGTCAVCGAPGLVARATRTTVDAARVMFSAGGAS